MQGVRTLPPLALPVGLGVVLGMVGKGNVTDWGNLTIPGAGTQLVALVAQPVTAAVLPESASTLPAAQPPTPVSGLENVPLMTVLAAVFTLPLEPRFPM